jgi:hypothetical protein
MAKFVKFVSIPVLIGSFLLSIWLANTSRFIILAGLIIGLFLSWVWFDAFSKQKLRESLFRNVGVPYRNLIGLLLGATASLLPLTSGAATTLWATWVFLSLLGITMVLLVAVRPRVEAELDRFAWGLLVIIVLGFGLGALIYQTRSWWIYLWHQYLKINNTGAILLEALFLLGVILGFFVVRNWAKEQKDFVSSLSAVLSGAFVATLLGKLQEGNTPAINPMRAFAFYALGFTISGALNLLAAACLTANYVNKRSVTSRSIIDFLYGSERTKVIDGYFLKNFEEDKDYAKRWLASAVSEFSKLVQREFAEQLEKKRTRREEERRHFMQTLGREKTTLERKQRRLRDLEPACSKLKDRQDDLQEFQDEHDALNLLQEPREKKQEARLKYLTRRMNQLDEEIKELKDDCSAAQFEQWTELTQELSEYKPSYFYQLIAIECDEKPKDPSKARAIAPEDREYHVVYKHIGSPDADKIEGGMFRVGVSARWQETLEYITAPGEYRVPFPYKNSVAGLALEFGQTIVMDRDIHKRFRNKLYSDGICPRDIEQNRGLDEIDFLSYIAIPIVSRQGNPDQNAVGVVTIDTRLFVTSSKLDGQQVNAAEGIFRTRMKRAQLAEYASNLYDQEDLNVRYVENLTNVITPVIELYSKCRIGAT